MDFHCPPPGPCYNRGGASPYPSASQEILSGKPSILVLNGPNLNMLGTRETEIYGSETLADIERGLQGRAEGLGLGVDFRQSNDEGELVGWIQEARGKQAAVIINAGAYTHTSVAILDALKMYDGPVIEVHLSNIYKRESFRHVSYISQVAQGVICGFSSFGYVMALEAAERLVAGNDKI